MEENIEELTLLLMYLTSWEEKGFIRDENDEIMESKVKTCWKGYSFDVINKLTKGKSITLTPAGEKLAKKLMDKYLK